MLAQARLLRQAPLRQAQRPAASELVELQKAHALLTEARTIAERAGYVLDLADIHNLLAKLALDGGDRDAARDHAQQARDYAWCDGPEYSYRVALDEADRLLWALA